MEKAADSAGNRLNEDGIAELRADPEPRIANQTDQIRMAAQNRNLLLFCKTQLAKARGDFRRRRQALDANRGTRNHTAQGADKWIAIACLGGADGTRFVHWPPK